MGKCVKIGKKLNKIVLFIFVIFFFLFSLVGGSDEGIFFNNLYFFGESSTAFFSEGDDLSEIILSSSPTITITEPFHNSKHLINKRISFKHTVENLEEDYSVRWDLGDGFQIFMENCLVNNCDIDHTYLKRGRKGITLELFNLDGSRISTSRRIIYIYDTGINVFAIGLRTGLRGSINWCTFVKALVSLVKFSALAK